MEDFNLIGYLSNNPLNENQNTNGIMYDFGGSDYPDFEEAPPNIKNFIIVDKADPDMSGAEDYDFDVSFIKGDLSSPLTLPHKAQVINCSKIFRYLSDVNPLIKNIDKHLVSGGELRIFEDSYDEEENYGELMDYLLKTFKGMGYTLKLKDSFNTPDYIENLVFIK